MNASLAPRESSQHEAASQAPGSLRPGVRLSHLGTVKAKIGLSNKTNRPAIGPENDASLLDDDRKATPLSR